MTTQKDWTVTVEQQQIQEIKETLVVLIKTINELTAIVSNQGKRIYELERKQ